MPPFFNFLAFCVASGKTRFPNNDAALRAPPPGCEHVFKDNANKPCQPVDNVRVLAEFGCISHAIMRYTHHLLRGWDRDRKRRERHP